MTSVKIGIPGFIPLCEAADTIGRGMYGEGWHPIGEVGTNHIPSNEELIEAGYLQKPITEDDPDYLASIVPMRERFYSNRRAEIIIGRTDPAIERVIRSLAERLETGEIGTWYRSITGVDALDCSVWRASNWRSYFVNSEIELELPLVGDNLRPVDDGRTAKCARPIFVRQRDVDALVRTLTVAAAPAKPRQPTAAEPIRQRGPPEQYDWDEGIQFMRQELDTRGDPRDRLNVRPKGWRSDIDVAKLVAAHIAIGGEEPDLKHTARVIRAQLKKWRAEQAERN